MNLQDLSISDLYALKKDYEMQYQQIQLSMYVSDLSKEVARVNEARNPISHKMHHINMEIHNRKKLIEWPATSDFY